MNVRLPDNFCGMTRKQAMQLLGVKSRSTIDDYQYLLNGVESKLWDYMPGSRGFSDNAFLCLKVAQRLIKTVGAKQAARDINQKLLEIEKNGY